MKWNSIQYPLKFQPSGKDISSPKLVKLISNQPSHKIIQTNIDVKVLKSNMIAVVKLK